MLDGPKTSPLRVIERSFSEFTLDVREGVPRPVVDLESSGLGTFDQSLYQM